MSYERQQRCRYWPDCMIHVGEGKTQLTPLDAEEIRILRDAGWSTYALAREFHCGRTAIRNVLTNRTFRARVVGSEGREPSRP